MGRWRRLGGCLAGGRWSGGGGLNQAAVVAATVGVTTAVGVTCGRNAGLVTLSDALFSIWLHYYRPYVTHTYVCRLADWLMRSAALYFFPSFRRLRCAATKRIFALILHVPHSLGGNTSTTVLLHHHTYFISRFLRYSFTGAVFDLWLLLLLDRCNGISD